VILEGTAGSEADSVESWRTYAGFRRSMETFRRTLNVDCIGLITPVEDPVRADIRGLEGSPGGTMA
jgi:hypothetical protein